MMRTKIPLPIALKPDGEAEEYLSFMMMHTCMFSLTLMTP